MCYLQSSNFLIRHHFFLPKKKVNILGKKFYSLLTIIFIVNIQIIQIKIL